MGRREEGQLEEAPHGARSRQSAALRRRVASGARRLTRWIQAPAVRAYLRRARVTFGGTPVFSGRWPHFDNDGSVVLGEGCRFHSFRLRTHITVRECAELQIGEGSFFNDGIDICATVSVKIGDHAKIGDMVQIYDTDFHEVAPGRGVRQSPVLVGRNVWIGASSIVLPGASIGDHCVVGAASVVTGVIPAKSIVAGAPARVVGTIDAPDGWSRD